MSNLKCMTSGSVKILMERVIEELEDLAQERGLEIKTGAGRYTTSCLTMRLELAIASEDGSPVGKDAEAFKNYCIRWSMPSTDLGRTFERDDGVWKIVGARPRSRRAPILIERQSDGKRVRTGFMGVKALLKEQE